ncbi:hypothetical protein SK128_027736 [Halocaridina rubra]|uniref:Uncharacterized protein n=1 Tax=Halocaridina rubra TaxID=373956 RepID=A0AAN8WRU5_HALRR
MSGQFIGSKSLTFHLHAIHQLTYSLCEVSVVCLWPSKDQFHLVLDLTCSSA